MPLPDTRDIVACFTLRNLARDWCDLAHLSEADIDRQPCRFVGGRNSWIAQTYVRLRESLLARGWQVRASSRFEPGALCIAHRDDANDFTSGAHRSHLIVVRADRPPVHACDHVIVQNALAARGDEHFLPLWPQPGMRPRSPLRGARVRRLAYLGRTGASPEWFFAPDFHRALRERSVAFDVRPRDWDDYRDIDVAIAARVAAPGMLDVKPATKLYNAWLARVPMLASPEPAYCELRRSPLDFIEVEDERDVLRAIDLLRANPRLYQAMVDNGLERSREFSVDAIRARWLDLFDHVVVPAYAAHRDTLASRRLWFLGAMTRQKIEAKLFRAKNDWNLMRLAPSRRAALAHQPAIGSRAFR